MHVMIVDTLLQVLADTLQTTQSRDTKTWDPSCIGVKVGKVIFNLISLDQAKVMG